MKKNVILMLLIAGTMLLSACSGGGTTPPETWTVSFELDGGTVGGATFFADVEVTKGSSLGAKLKTPERTGSWEFAGWFDASGDSDDEYTATTPITKDLTLKARWVSTDTTKWTVTFNTDGGGSIPSIQVTKGQPMGDQYPEAPVKTGFEFDGWYLASDTNFSGTKYDATTNITADTDLKAKWKSTGVTIVIDEIGKEGADSVTASPASGLNGAEITLNYTLANTKLNNRLTFSGTTAAIEEVDETGTGTRTYTIAEEDATDGVITIIATFVHSNKTLDTIAFANTSNETIVYGTTSFSKAITTTGSGTGAISYASSDETVATVNASTGAVTTVKVGHTTIIATKAADATYEQATAEYLLTIEPRQLTVGNTDISPLSKVYDGTTTKTVTTAGTLNNKVGSDDVAVSAVATYDSADVGTGKTITIVYSISGADAGNYIKPADFRATGGSITIAPGADVSAGPTADEVTDTTITINAVTTSGGQSVEYAISTTADTEPTEDWQDELTFSGLTPSTGYYIFARSKADANHNAGTAKVSSEITTEAATSVIPDSIVVDFTEVTFAQVGGAAAPTSVSSTGYTYQCTNFNMGIAFKFSIGDAKLSDYDKISFTVAGSGTDFNNKPCNVFGASGSGAAPSYIQPPGNANAAAVTTFSSGNNITGSSPFALTFTIDKTKAITDELTGEIWLAIFIHAGATQTYTISDFRIFKTTKVDFTEVTFAQVGGAAAPTNVSSTSYTYQCTNFNMGIAFKFSIGDAKLSDYDKISFTVAGSGTDYNNKPCNVFGALGSGAAPSYIQPPGNANAAAVTTFSSGNNITGSSPFALIFTIDKTKAITDNLTGEIWLAIFIHAGATQTYTISNFELY